ncbi:hypothetical protein Tco_0505622 [Tanacetum coccineum]
MVVNEGESVGSTALGAATATESRETTRSGGLKKKFAETMAKTMEQYISKTRADYGSGVAKPKIKDKDNFELKGQFLKELCDNTFSGSDHKDANEHIENEVVLFYNGLDVPTRQILDSRGAIPSKTVADAKVAIQEMAEYSQKWHNGTSRTRSTETSDGLAAIQAQLNNLGREIKKVNEKVYAAQVGCEQCKGPHYTKDCPLKEEGKTLEEAYYTQFGAPFQGGGYRATTSGFYQRNNANPSYQERRQSMEDTLSKFMSESAKRHEENSNLIKEIRASTDAAIRNQGASTKTLEIQIGQMSKIDVFKRKITLRVGEERIIFKSVKPASSVTKRVYMLGLRERMELDLEARLMRETLVLNRSLDPFFGDYIELNDFNVPLELRRDQVDYLIPTVEEGEIVEEFRARNDARMELNMSEMRRWKNDSETGTLMCMRWNEKKLKEKV